MRAHVEPERVNGCFLLKCEFGFGQSWKDTESGPAGKAGLLRFLRYKTRVGSSWGAGLPYIYIYTRYSPKPGVLVAQGSLDFRFGVSAVAVLGERASSGPSVSPGGRLEV